MLVIVNSLAMFAVPLLALVYGRCPEYHHLRQNARQTRRHIVMVLQLKHDKMTLSAVSTSCSVAGVQIGPGAAYGC